jgi:hypothetical protein
MDNFYLKYEWRFVRFRIIPVDKIEVERVQLREIAEFTEFPPSPLGCGHDNFKLIP